MVESQLISDPNPHMPKPLELEKSIPFFNELKITKCKHCNTSFSKNDPILHYQHPSGWIVPGYEKKQWLFIVCSNCGYQWALWKLGVGKSLLPIQHEKQTPKLIIPFVHQNDDPNYDPLIGSKLDLEMQIEDQEISKDILIEDLEKACIEKVELQKNLAEIHINIEKRLMELAKYDPFWEVDSIPEEMEKRQPEIDNLNEILNLIKSH